MSKEIELLQCYSDRFNQLLGAERGCALEGVNQCDQAWARHGFSKDQALAISFWYARWNGQSFPLKDPVDYMVREWEKHIDFQSWLDRFRGCPDE